MDDDWLEVDESELQRKLAQNERDNISSHEQNLGYLNGLEWADKNFKSVDIMAEPKLVKSLEKGILIGKTSASSRKEKYFFVGQLNVAMLTSADKQLVVELLAKLDKADTDADILASLRT